MAERHRVVIVGGGFGGLYAALHLKDPRVAVTLLDRRNFHLFQPLLYQVATGGLSPGDISSPLRLILKRHHNARVLLAEATGIDVAGRRVLLGERAVEYDTLIVGTGARHHYFGNDHWEEHAPGLKTIEEATEIRRRILLAFECAELEPDPQARRALLTFVIVGGGPTGVELAGAVSELARDTMRQEFRAIDPAETAIVLLEGLDRVLSAYPPVLSAKAERSLVELGVTVRKGARVVGIEEGLVRVRQGEREEELRARTILWAAGVLASPVGRMLSERTGAALDRSGRVVVEPDLALPGHPEILVVGDLAHFAHQGGAPLPGVAPVAMQQGRYAARRILARLAGSPIEPFRYRDKGTVATIGRSRAVAEIGRLHLGGFVAWVLWLVIHIFHLIEFENRILVMIQWTWNYLTRNRGARLITGERPRP